MKDIKIDPFEEYIRQTEPSRKELGYAWYTAMGLQAVDGLETSEHLKDVARDNIDGKITLPEANKLIETYYEESAERDKDRSKEADIVTGRIAAILSENAFTFSVPQYVGIHKRLFMGVFLHAGKIRDYNISKHEWVLDGASVHYGNALELRELLEYDLRMEKEYEYSLDGITEMISHLAKFVSRLWQIHVFGEGNTRTTAVFFIKYLRSLGFDVTNDLFAKHSWYFRNALVRANYNDYTKNIRETTEYLELFLRNLLLGETNELKNRYMHVRWDETTHSEDKRHIEQHIPDENDILKVLDSNKVSSRTKDNIVKLHDAFGKEKVFGRSDVIEILGITEKPASTLLGKMHSIGITEKITGAGKGRYRFIV